MSPYILSMLQKFKPIFINEQGDFKIPELSRETVKKAYQIYQGTSESELQCAIQQQLINAERDVADLLTSIRKLRDEKNTTQLQLDIISIAEKDLIVEIIKEIENFKREKPTETVLYRLHQLTSLIKFTDKALESPTDIDNLNNYKELYKSFTGFNSFSPALKKATKVFLDVLIVASYLSLYFISVNPVLAIGICAAYYADWAYNSLQTSQYVYRLAFPKATKDLLGRSIDLKQPNEYGGFFSGSYGIYSEYKQFKKERYMRGREISKDFLETLEKGYGSAPAKTL